MQHLEEGEIHAWLDGALSEAEGARIEQHAATCKECAAMVADARGLIAGAARIVSALDHVPSGVIPKSGAASTASRPLWRALRLTPFRAALAASLVVAAGSLIVVQRIGADLMVPQAKEVVTMPAAAAPPPTPVEAPKAKSAVADASNEARQLSERVAPKPPPPSSKTTLALSDSTLLMKAAPESQTTAPKVASAEDQRAKKERDSILSNAVVTPAPASAVGGTAGQTAAREPSRDSTRASADIAFRRALPPAVQRAEGASSFALSEAPSFVGCYQIADTARWPVAIPSRFALAADSTAGGVQLTMRRLMSTGRPDSAAIGGWSRLTPTSVNVGLNTAAPPASFILARNGGTYTATVPRSGATTLANVIRRDCPR